MEKLHQSKIRGDAVGLLTDAAISNRLLNLNSVCLVSGNHDSKSTEKVTSARVLKIQLHGN